MSGEAEAGSTITIKDPSGNVVGEGKADSDGKFSIDLTAPQISGEQLTVTATDDAGNTGPSATIDAPNVPLPIHQLSPPLSMMPLPHRHAEQ